MNHSSHYKEIKLVVTVTLLVILFFCGGITFALKKNHDSSLLRDLEINVLSTQMETLKNENVQLRDEIIGNNNELKEIYSKIIVYNKALSTEKDKNTALEKELQQKITEKEQTISQLAQKNTNLKNELQISLPNENITSFLILGQNKGLTDTIIVASANPQKKTLSMFSLPRDLYYKGRKINELNSADGIGNLKSAIKDITGIAVDKYAIFDFDSFVKIVDGIGGIDISVKKAFTDNSYPGSNNSYLKVSFAAGIQHMDGARALIYARSRKSTSDFDRSARQQQVVTAIKNKIMELNLISALPAYTALYDEINKSIQTDMGLFETLGYYEDIKNYKVKTGNVISTGNYLYSKISDRGQYILLPTGGSYTKIKQYISDIVSA